MLGSHLNDRLAILVLLLLRWSHSCVCSLLLLLCPTSYMRHHSACPPAAAGGGPVYAHLQRQQNTQLRRGVTRPTRGSSACHADRMEACTLCGSFSVTWRTECDLPMWSCGPAVIDRSLGAAAFSAALTLLCMWCCGAC